MYPRKLISIAVISIGIGISAGWNLSVDASGNTIAVGDTKASNLTNVEQLAVVDSQSSEFNKKNDRSTVGLNNADLSQDGEVTSEINSPKTNTASNAIGPGAKKQNSEDEAQKLAKELIKKLDEQIFQIVIKTVQEQKRNIVKAELSVRDLEDVWKKERTLLEKGIRDPQFARTLKQADTKARLLNASYLVAKGQLSHNMRELEQLTASFSSSKSPEYTRNKINQLVIEHAVLADELVKSGKEYTRYLTHIITLFSETINAISQ